MTVKEEREKAGLKLNIKKLRWACSPLISWQTEGEKVEAVTDFLFLGSKITADGNCSQDIKRILLLRREPLTNLDSVLKSRHQFADKGPYGQMYGFPSSHVWMRVGQ